MHIDRDTFYTLEEIAGMKTFRVSVRTLQRLISEGKVPARKFGGKTVILGSDLLNGLPLVRKPDAKDGE